MSKKVVKLNIKKTDSNQLLKLNNRSMLFRLEMVLNDLEELNTDKLNGSISNSEYYIRKSKIIQKLYSQD